MNAAPALAELIQAAARCERAGPSPQAIEAWQAVLRVDPRHGVALNRLGQCLLQMGHAREAAQAFEAALAQEPSQVEAWVNLGVARRRAGRLDEAVAAYDQALARQPGHAAARRNRALVLVTLGRIDEALAELDALLALNPDDAELHYRRGVALHAMRRLPQALASFDRAVALAPGRPDAWNDRGVALREMGRVDEALHSYEQALALAPGQAQLWRNQANALQQAGRHEAALRSATQAWRLQPGLPQLQGQRMRLGMGLAHWDGWPASRDALLDAVRRGEPAAEPFDLLALVDDPALHLQLAARHAQRWPAAVATRPPTEPPLGFESPGPGPTGRLKIGYFSPDFGDHPVSHLLCALFEAHDRDRFEVHAYAFGAGRAGPWRERVRRAVDRFDEVDGLTDEAVARLARQHGLQVAVDLAGYTAGARPGVFAARAAPVQVSYVGYLGTSGAPFIDYLVADAVLVPPAQRRFHREQLLSLPCYQCNAPLSEAIGPPPSRRSVGLPDDAVVLCAFNHTYKLLPEVFDDWMRILAQAPQTVLWLYAEQAAAFERLRQRAIDRGIAGERLIHATRVPLDAHLARQALADLFLDTFPYNAGATASNALRAGVPLLTRSGQSMASRMGASLLHAAGLPELVTETPQAYVALAVQLAHDRQRLGALRQRLAQGLPHSRLFDPSRFARSLEAACVAMVDRWARGLPAAALVVDENDRCRFDESA